MGIHNIKQKPSFKIVFKSLLVFNSILGYFFQKEASICDFFVPCEDELK